MSLCRHAFVLLLTAAVLGPSVMAPTARAETAGETSPRLSIAEFGAVLQYDAMFEVLRDEGIAQAAELADTMLATGNGPGWNRAVERIYDLPSLRARFNHALRVRLTADPALTAEAQRFFASDLGQRVLTLEIAARRAFLDIAQEEAARVAADTPETARDAKWGQIRRIMEAGDLVEQNVSAGLSGSLRFMQGLQETGATGMAVPVEELSGEVWGQEEHIRADAYSWLKAYFGLAYAPLSEAELETYVAFLESPAGRHYSAALAFAYAEAFLPLSRKLGRAVGEASQARDI